MRVVSLVPSLTAAVADSVPGALVDGRHLTWYGPSLAVAPRVIGAALRAAVR